MIPWWVALLIGVASGLIVFTLGHWKILPAVTKRQKKEEKQAAEAERSRQEEKRKKLDALNAAWKRNREALSRVREPLVNFNRMNKDPDSPPGKRCMEMADQILEAAQQLDDSPTFADIKERLVEYARRGDKIYASTILPELRAAFQRDLGQGDKGIFEPLALWHGAEAVLKQTEHPPFSEKNV